MLVFEREHSVRVEGVCVDGWAVVAVCEAKSQPANLIERCHIVLDAAQFVEL